MPATPRRYEGEEYRVHGPETCPHPCGTCPDRCHHWYEEVAEDENDPHPAHAIYHEDAWYACKHCEAWAPCEYVWSLEEGES